MQILEHIRDLAEPWSARTLLRATLLWNYLYEFHTLYGLFDVELDFLQDKIKPYFPERPVLVGVCVLSDDSTQHLSIVNGGGRTLATLYAKDDLKIKQVIHKDVDFGEGDDGHKDIRRVTLIELHSATRHDRYIVGTYATDKELSDAQKKLRKFSFEHQARMAFKSIGKKLLHQGKEMQNVHDHDALCPLLLSLDDQDKRFNAVKRKKRFEA
jgi:hypothetical protein